MGIYFKLVLLQNTFHSTFHALVEVFQYNVLSKYLTLFFTYFLKLNCFFPWIFLTSLHPNLSDSSCLFQAMGPWFSFISLTAEAGSCHLAGWYWSMPFYNRRKAWHHLWPSLSLLRCPVCSWTSPDASLSLTLPSCSWSSWIFFAFFPRLLLCVNRPLPL